jgi:hypothetical protein
MDEPSREITFEGCFNFRDLGDTRPRTGAGPGGAVSFAATISLCCQRATAVAWSAI